MTSKRAYYLLLGLCVFFLLATIGGVYMTQGFLQSKASELATTKQKSQLLDQEQLALVSAKKEVVKYGPLEQITQQVVPQDKNQAETVREIVNIASQSGITLSSITFPISTLGGASASAGAVIVPHAALPGTKQAAPTNLSQLTPVLGIPGVYALQIEIQDSQQAPVSYNQLYSFLQKLENNRRTSQVSNINISPISGPSGLLTFSLSLNEYIKP